MTRLAGLSFFDFNVKLRAGVSGLELSLPINKLCFSDAASLKQDAKKLDSGSF